MIPAGAHITSGVDVIVAGAAVLAAIAAGLAAVGYIARLVRRLVRIGSAIEHMVSNELTHNHGSSIKDDVYGIAVAVGKLSRRIDAIETHLKERHHYL